jgi:hypothetical protein
MEKTVFEITKMVCASEENLVRLKLDVIAAGVLVYLLGSNKPDLIVGTIVFVMVIRGH